MVSRVDSLPAVRAAGEGLCSIRYASNYSVPLTRNKEKLKYGRGLVRARVRKSASDPGGKTKALAEPGWFANRAGSIYWPVFPKMTVSRPGIPLFSIAWAYT